MGIDERMPVMKRPMNTAAMFGVAATGMQKMLYRSAEAMYNLFRPKLSEYGEQSRLPSPWPIKYLFSYQLRDRNSIRVIILHSRKSCNPNCFANTKVLQRVATR